MNLIILFAVCVVGVFCESDGKGPENTRQKKLLFYDEEGNLVKTYSNPFNSIFQNPDKFPGVGYMNPFIAFLRPSLNPGFGNLPTPYMIPVSDEASQTITDPLYQNKVFFLPSREQNIFPTSLCQGKRAQIASAKCSSFLNCWDGWAYEQECPPGLMFSSMGYCDYPNKVNCFDRRVVNEIPDVPSQSQSQSDSATTSESPKCSKDFEAFRNELKCTEFFVCVNRAPVRFKCPADLAFNQELGICDYSNRVDCNASLGVNTEAPQQDKAPASAPADLPSGLKSLIMRNSVFNSQSFSSTHVAMSRQDAIRQLELNHLAKVSTN